MVGLKLCESWSPCMFQFCLTNFGIENLNLQIGISHSYPNERHQRVEFRLVFATIHNLYTLEHTSIFGMRPFRAAWVIQHIMYTCVDVFVLCIMYECREEHNRGDDIYGVWHAAIIASEWVQQILSCGYINKNIQQKVHLS